MTTLLAAHELITEDEYLAGEILSDVKHEYLAGMIYAMAGASEPHNIIAANLAGLLYVLLKGKTCQPFGLDMKLRLQARRDHFYYYPDAMIACDPQDSGHGWRERPSVLFEIISEATRRVDAQEKRLAYEAIPSLEAYVLIEQNHPLVEVELRTADGWILESLSGLDQTIRLPKMGLEIPLADLYDRLNFGVGQ